MSDKEDKKKPKKKRVRNKSTGRDYKKEYKNYQGKEEQIEKRVSRDKARRKLQKEGKVTKGSGKDVDHKDGNPKNNKKDNLRVVNKTKNRSFKRNKNGGKIYV
jgi:hypothetical protein